MWQALSVSLHRIPLSSTNFKKYGYFSVHWTSQVQSYCIPFICAISFVSPRLSAPVPSLQLHSLQNFDINLDTKLIFRLSLSCYLILMRTILPQHILCSLVFLLNSSPSINSIYLRNCCVPKSFISFIIAFTCHF